MMDRVIEGAVGKALSHTDVRTVFGEPVKQGEYTVIPVARVTANYGFGAGSGEGERKDAPNRGSGGGGGGRVRAHPIGFIEMSNDSVQFVPIVDRGEIFSRLGTIALIAALFILPALLFNRQSRPSKRSMWGR
jgi:uncharacterized spore protein YtfJ